MCYCQGHLSLPGPLVPALLLLPPLHWQGRAWVCEEPAPRNWSRLKITLFFRSSLTPAVFARLAQRKASMPVLAQGKRHRYFWQGCLLRLFTHNPQKVVIPRSPGLQPAQAMPSCVRKDTSSHAMSGLGVCLWHCCGRRAAETGKAGLSLPHLHKTPACDHIVSPDRPRHPQSRQRGCITMPCSVGSQEALELEHSSGQLGRAWGRAGKADESRSCRA